RSGSSATTMSNRSARPARAPSAAGCQPRTEATASTIVSASTASTSELRNAVVTAGAAVVQIIYGRAVGSRRSKRLISSIGPVSPEHRQLSEVLCEQVIDRYPILGSVTLHLIGSHHDRLVEFRIGLGQPQFLLKKMVSHTRNFFLVGEGHQ